MKKQSSILMATLLIFTLSIPMVHAWEIDRPKDYVSFWKERDETSYSDGKASIGLGVDISSYLEDYPLYPAYGNDYVLLRVVLLEVLGK